MSKLRVGIICGGKSSEHEISCVSANGILSAIDRNKFEPVLVGITNQVNGFFCQLIQVLSFKMVPYQ
ncbi:D-alanine--D-alanine ligase A [Actinomycetota bacterium]|nr:D-alanine--D-alanine ligase A [Actinomycetota bacterium]